MSTLDRIHRLDIGVICRRLAAGAVAMVFAFVLAVGNARSDSLLPGTALPSINPGVFSNLIDGVKESNLNNDFAGDGFVLSAVYEAPVASGPFAAGDLLFEYVLVNTSPGETYSRFTVGKGTDWTSAPIIAVSDTGVPASQMGPPTLASPGLAPFYGSGLFLGIGGPYPAETFSVTINNITTGNPLGVGNSDVLYAVTGPAGVRVGTASVIDGGTGQANVYVPTAAVPEPRLPVGLASIGCLLGLGLVWKRLGLARVA